jgi:hypothetical protein
MANPNIVNVTSIYGETAVFEATTANANVVQNASASGEIYKVNSLIISNIDGVSDAGANVSVVRSDTYYYLGYSLAVPVQSSLVLISKDSSIYLKEGDAIMCTASANNDVHVVCSYEVIS